MPSLVTWRLLMSAAVCVATASSGHAQRVVRESAAQYRAARALTLVATQRWCTDANAEGCEFRNIADALVLDDGGIIAADLGGPMHRFGASGQFVGAVSRKGRGPGEYRYISAPQLLSSSSLAWFDQALMRVTTLSLSGTPGPAPQLRLPAGVARIGVANGELIVLEVPPGTAVGDNVQATYHTVPASGEPRVLARVATPSLFAPGAPMRALPPLFSPEIVSGIGWAGDIAHGNGALYLVQMFPARGTAWTLDIARSPRAVTAAERNAAIAEALADAKVTTVAALSDMTRSSIERARTIMPALRALRVLRDGTVWICPTPDPGATRVRWDVFSRDGARIGYALLSSTATIVDGARQWILTVQPGTDDVPTVTRYSVP